MDNPDIMSGFSQADISLLRSFISRIPPTPPNTPIPEETRISHEARQTISAPAVLVPSTQPSLTGSQVPVPYPSQFESISTGYQPAALRRSSAGHPVRTAPPLSILHSRNPVQPPFQGIQSLGSAVTRQVVNQQRLASAAATIPRQPALQARTARRGRRPGTANMNPPGLPAPPTMDDALVRQADGSVQLKIRVKIYPPTENPNTLPVLFTNYADSFNAVLESYFLTYDYTIQPNMSLSSLTDKIVQDMTTCPMQYQFSARFPHGIARHEAQPLRVLALNNRGRSRPTTGQVYLQKLPVSSNTQISGLFTDRNFYANPRFCLENDRFILYFVVVHYPFSAMIRTEDSAEIRRHKCISDRIYRQFPHDGHSVSDGIELDCTSSSDESGNDNNITDEDEVEVDHVLRSHLRRRIVHRPLRRTAAVGNILEEPRNPAATEIQTLGPLHRPDSNSGQVMSQPHSIVMGQFLPPSIWDSLWLSPPVVNRIEGLMSVDDVGDHVYNLFPPGHRLSIRGKNVEDLAAQFRLKLAGAASSKDFSIMLASERDFIIENTDGSVRSIGTGVENEVLYIAYQQLQSNFSQWFNPRIDNMASIAVMHTFMSAAASSTARREAPLSPIFLQWIIHDCDLNALHSDLISEWHPELHATIKQWLAVGPTGPLEPFQSHFSTWHDTQAKASHKYLAAEMLYKAVIGSVPPYHPEIQDFIAGFRLPCVLRPDFDFFHVLKSFIGGPELYLSVIWTSQIKTFDDLAPFLHYRASSSLSIQAFSGFGDEDITLNNVISSFLQSSGIPCPKLFEDAKSHFSPLINLDRLDEPAFRTKMFCWAATGSPTFGSESGDIAIYLVNDNDTAYSCMSLRDSMLQEGKISFKTCTHQVRIPASYFSTLSHQSYNESSEPASLEKAVHHWLLCEILNAIGNHSIL